MLVCFGCTLFAELSGAFGSPSPDRVAAQIVTGVGFLGAGTILRTGLEVKGLTTAASIWAVAAIGMAVSVGGPFFWVAIIATALTLGTLKLVAALEGKVAGGGDFRRMNLVVESRDIVAEVILAVTDAGGEVGRVDGEETRRRIWSRHLVRRRRTGLAAACCRTPRHPNR